MSIKSIPYMRSKIITNLERAIFYYVYIYINELAIIFICFFTLYAISCIYDTPSFTHSKYQSLLMKSISYLLKTRASLFPSVSRSIRVYV